MNSHIRQSREFLQTSGLKTGTGPYATWKKRGIDQRVIDAALLAAVQHLRFISMDVKADQVLRLAYEMGCRHPDVVDSWAGLLAVPGRLADFEAAAEVCDHALLLQDGSTSDAWRRLRSRRNQLSGRAQRLVVRPSGNVDEDGNAIPVRKHTPATPRRSRNPRFTRMPTRTSAS
jgi:hypothetical protein